MINVGVIGIGSMGNCHLDIYAKRKDVKVLAISDIDPERLSGKSRATGNIEGQVTGAFDLATVRRYDEGMKLIADPEIDLVDITTWTPLHVHFAIAALKAGKHVLVEKPLAINSADARKLIAAAKKSKKFIMCAQCMRFWPGWVWLKEMAANKTYGKLLSAHFRRLASHPGGAFYTDGKRCGGAVLDLHIHDTDYIQSAFGILKAVQSVGYSTITGAIDHILTRYDYGKNGPMIIAEGGWAMAQGFGFTMQFTANFQKATAVFDLSTPNLKIIRDGKTEPVEIPAGMGYDHEIDYFLNCIATKRKPRTVTIESAAVSVKIVEAEVRSCRTGKRVAIRK